MNLTFKKKLISIILAVCAACLFAAAIRLVPDRVEKVHAAGNTVDVNITSDKAEVIPGGTVKLTFTMSTGISSCWSSVDLRLVPLNEDGTANDALFEYISFTRGTAVVYGDAATKYTNSTSDQTGAATNKSIRIVLSARDVYTLVPASENLVIEVPIVIDSGITAVQNLEKITFGFRATSSNKIVLNEEGGSNDTKHELTGSNGGLTLHTIDIGLKVPSSDATLSGLQIGTEGNMKDVPIADKMTYEVDGSDIGNLKILPTANDGATIKVGLTNPPTIDVESGKEGSVSLLPWSDNTTSKKVYIQMTAEDGTKKTYEVTVTMGYVALSNLTVKSRTSTVGVTKDGLSVEFDPDTLNYTAYIPDDTTAADVTATVASGYGARTTINLVGIRCSTNPAVTSGTRTGVTVIENGGRLSLQVTASNGTTKTYSITFQMVSVDTEISSLDVTGVDSGNTYGNNAEKATEKGADYFFLMTDETQMKGKFNLSLHHAAATAKIGAVDYNENAEFEAATYIFTVTAEAGNTKEYTVILSGPTVLELALTSKYQFITEIEEIEDGEYLYFRRTYAELNWKHGVDDKNLERIVLGQILPETTVNEFLENFDSSQYSMMKIIDGDDNIIYNYGRPGDGYTEADFDSYDDLRISTGWRIEFGAGATPSDIVYLCVFGDLDGDGMMGAADNVAVLAHIEGVAELETLDFKLAAYVVNGGSIGAEDAVEILSMIEGLTEINDHLYLG